MALGDVALLVDNRVENSGAVIAEQYDFGSAPVINGVFRDLVGVSPFSKSEARTFDKFLSERHLLVHHAGIYTLHWLKNGRPLARTFGAELFRDRLSFSTKEYHERSDFIFDMAIKVARTSVCAAREITLRSASHNNQIEQYTDLLQGLWDSLE